MANDFGLNDIISPILETEHGKTQYVVFKIDLVNNAFFLKNMHTQEIKIESQETMNAQYSKVFSRYKE